MNVMILIQVILLICFLHFSSGIMFKYNIFLFYFPYFPNFFHKVNAIIKIISLCAPVCFIELDFFMSCFLYLT